MKKSGFDFENGILKGGLKTDAGKDRIIPIHPKIKGYIEYWYNQTNDKDETLFFYIDKNGKRRELSDDYFRKKFYYNILDRLGIKRHVIHCTRHTAATKLMEAGASPEAIQRILGHSSYAFTVDTYTHADIDFLKENMKKM